MCVSITNDETKLSWNKAEANLRHFRTLADVSTKSNTNSLGIRGRYVSGSGQFTLKNIYLLTEKVKQVAGSVEKIIIVDVRKESHGFVNGLPVDWKVKNSDANKDKSHAEILKDEKEKLQKLFQNKIIDEVVVETVCTEEEFALENGFGYVRLPTLDHSHPNDETVDAFINLIKKNPNAWLHIHCHVGKGRTTSFMVLYDIFYNCKELKLEEILNRHKEIDGQDFEKHLSKTDLDQRKRDLFDNRLNFLKNFYRYCKESDSQTITWQTWLQEEKSKLLLPGNPQTV